MCSSSHLPKRAISIFSNIEKHIFVIAQLTYKLNLKAIKYLSEETETDKDDVDACGYHKVNWTNANKDRT